MLIDKIWQTFKRDQTIKRHLIKTISWRIIGSIDTVILGWFVTGNLSTGAKIGGFELITKMIFYFSHERIWQEIKFGQPSRFKIASEIQKKNQGNLFIQPTSIKYWHREKMNKVSSPSFTIWLTGLSGAGKSTIAVILDEWFYKNGLRAYLLDGDNIRLGINSDLLFSKDDRKENIRRASEICKLFNEAGIIIIASFISPFETDRQMAKNIVGREKFVLTYIDTDVNTCRERDVKGLYKMAEEGKIKGFTGVDSPYEIPENYELRVSTTQLSAQESADVIINYLRLKKIPKQEAYN